MSNTMKRSRREKFVVLVALAVPVGLLAVGLGYITFKLTPPREEAPFLAQFRDNRETFDELRVMFQADTEADTNITFIANREPQPYYSDAQRLSAKRLSQYKLLLTRVGAKSALRENDAIGFSLASWGGMDKGWNLSVAWRKTPPPKLVSHWEDLRRSPPGRNYRHIEGNWYLCMAWD